MTILSDQLQLAPAELDSYWMPFTANRQFKAAPRMFGKAEGMYYWTSEGRKILDGFAGLWCCNAGHCRKPIVEAIQKQAGLMKYPGSHAIRKSGGTPSMRSESPYASGTVTSSRSARRQLCRTACSSR